MGPGPGGRERVADQLEFGDDAEGRLQWGPALAAGNATKLARCDTNIPALQWGPALAAGNAPRRSPRF